MQHHIDELSVTDVRYTLGEAWRVIRNRRWHFLLPFCAVATIALVCSLWVPRTYTASTIIKREHDPVLASMMGRAWTEPYGEIRKQMAGDISDPDFLIEVLAELDLPSNLPRFDNGDLTPEGEQLRRNLALKISEGLSITPVETSPNRDVLTIRLALDDSTYLPEILSECRDRYVRLVQKKTVRILRDVKHFFQAESERSRAVLAGVQKEIIEAEMKYPGIDPALPDPTQAEQTSLIVERLDLERKLEELTARRDKLLALLASSSSEDEALAAPDVCDAPQQINPRAEEIENEIRRLHDEIANHKLVRLMTDQHPTIVRLRKTIEAREAELTELPRTIPRHDATAEPGISPRRQMEIQLAEHLAELTAASARHEEIAGQIRRIERRRVETADQREAYLKLREQSERLREELAGWQANLGPIGHILAVEDSNRGIQFTTMQESLMAPRPVSPDARMVLFICLAIGTAVGVVFVLGAELFDRSFQTVKQLSTALTIPVIESVDEILTQATRRRRLIRQFVVMPVVSAGLVLALFSAGAVAYLSIEKPAKIESLKGSTIHLGGVAFSEIEP